MRPLRPYLGIFIFLVLVAGISASPLALGAPAAPQFGGFQAPAPEVREPVGDPVTDALRSFESSVANSHAPPVSILATPLISMRIDSGGQSRCASFR